GKEGPCWDQKHAVVYRGPFRQVEDDDGHVLRRGVRTAVCEKTLRIYAAEPYRRHLDLVPPWVLVPLADAPPFPCGAAPLIRPPRETKGERDALTRATSGTSSAPGDSKRGCC